MSCAPKCLHVSLHLDIFEANWALLVGFCDERTHVTLLLITTRGYISFNAFGKLGGNDDSRITNIFLDSFFLNSFDGLDYDAVVEGVEYVDAVLFGRQLLLCIVRKES